MDGYKEGHLYFASESVGEGHPDKMCDQVSDGILDACLKVDPNAKVAMETATKTNMVSERVRLDFFQNLNHCISNISFVIIDCLIGRGQRRQVQGRLREGCQIGL